MYSFPEDSKNLKFNTVNFPYFKNLSKSYMNKVGKIIQKEDGGFIEAQKKKNVFIVFKLIKLTAFK